MILIDGNGLQVSLESQAVSKAGQATIYKVKNINQVAKIYHKLDFVKRAHLENKIKFMIHHQPFTTKTPIEISSSVVWPLSLLYNNGEFVGFTMPFISNSIELSGLIVPLRKSSTNAIEKKFSKKNNTNYYIQRMTICYNLASVLNMLHESKNYVVTDLKPQNILIDINGKISLIDIDSIQVSSPSYVYNADAWSEEYCPPEFYLDGINPKQQVIDPSWDYFSFACCAYQILFQLPPFSGTVAGNTTLPMNIENKCFPHGKNKKLFIAIPPPHLEFKRLDQEIRDLFISCFDGEPNKRPNFKVWSNSLFKYLGNSALLKANVNTTKASRNILLPSSPTSRKNRITKGNLKNYLLAFYSNNSSTANFSLVLLVFFLISCYFYFEKVKAYQDVFNRNSYFTVRKNQSLKLLETYEVGTITWERRVFLTTEGEKVGWIKK